MDVQTLHDVSMLAYVSVRVWSARKLDRKASAKLTEQAAASADAARVNKYIMSGADDELRGIQKIARRARDVLEQHSLPWDDAGNRLIGNAEAFVLLGKLYKLETEFNAAADAFCEKYPQLREVSKAAMGDMANDEDYPPVEIVRGKFAFRSTVAPLPAGFSDMRTGLTDEQQAALKNHYQTMAAERFEDAMNAAWQRLQENVARYVDRLTPNDDGTQRKFQATMVEQLRETMSLLKGLNVFNNPEMERFRYQIEETLCKHDPDTLRTSIPVANSSLVAAQKILAKLNGMLAP